MSSAATTRKTICRTCGMGCPVVIKFEGDAPVSIKGDKDDTVFKGFFCSKGQQGFDQVNSVHRLLRPVKRQPDGTFATIASETALDEIAEKLARILAESGPRSIACYMGQGGTPEFSSYVFGESFLAAIGSPDWYTAMNIDQPGKALAWAMLGSWSAGALDSHSADVRLIVGQNPIVTFGSEVGPPHKLNKALTDGLKMIVIDPRRSETAKRAEIHMQPRPGEDAAILAAMVGVILSENLHDRAFCDENVQGVEALAGAVAPFTPEMAAARADIPARQIREAARLFARSERGVAVGATGANMSGHSTLNEYLLLVLNTLCGRYPKAGQPVRVPGVMLPPAQAKAQPRPPQPYRNLGHPMAVRGLEMSATGMPTAALPDQILHGPIRALISIGGNPATAFPDQVKTVQALEKLDLFVQLDIRMSNSSKCADYVIPSRVGMELENCSYWRELIGVYYPDYAGNVPGMYTPPVLPPMDGSDLLSGWEVFYGIAKRMGLQFVIPPRVAESGLERGPTAEVVLDMEHKPTNLELLAQLTANANIPLSRVLEAEGNPVLADPIPVGPRDPDCTARLDVGNPDMMDELAEVVREDFWADEEYPYRLTCRRNFKIFNSSGRDLPTFLKGRQLYNPAFIHPEDMAELGVEAGDMMEIRSRYGVIPAVAQPDDTLRPGLVSMFHGYGALPGEGQNVREVGSCVNLLVSAEDRCEPISGMPLMSAIPLQVRRWPGNGEAVTVAADGRPEDLVVAVSA
ncbi:MAG: molybdopterin-dependent oxidoreductase [Novosphingobium sp.]|nr:molybdopterin-dependent oxidoreductase [Novosphingobium sp.]